MAGKNKFKDSSYVLGFFIAFLMGAFFLLIVLKFFPNLTNKTITNVTKTEKEVTVTDKGIADAVEKVYDSVVIVENYKKDTLYATGTGFIYKYNDGQYYILTNYHVVSGATHVNVVMSNGNDVTVELLGGDIYADVAVLSYKTTGELQVAEIGSSEKMRVGDTVFAIGAPLDSTVYSWSVTRGVLSGKDRYVGMSVNNSYSNDWIMKVIQTDAAINSGNSGGPLCNSNGQVVGITNMKLVTTGVEGMGFAIPIEDAVNFADDIINGEDVSRPLLGVYMTDVANAQYSKEFDVGDQTKGVLVTDINKGSPADDAGLKIGDIIIEADNVKTDNSAQLRYQLYKHRVGDSMSVKYIRNGKENTTTVKLNQKAES